MSGPTQAQLDSAYTHLMSGVARNDALPPREAAINALGPGATDEQIAAWTAKWRPGTTAAA